MSPGQWSDSASHELLQRLRAGDRDALATIYRAFHDRLWRLGLLLARDPTIADDAVQEVMMALWTKRETLHVQGELRVYLFAAVRHHVYNVVQRKKRIAGIESALEASSSSEGGDVPAMGRAPVRPDHAAESADFRAAYAAALAALDERDRAAALLRWDEGLTFEQIGEILGMSNVGARALVLRVQRKLQMALAEFRR